MDQPAIVAISAGAEHSLCLDWSGSVYSFGNGGAGRLGLGSVQNTPTPQVLRLCNRVMYLNRALIE
jgi:alpha-tubulin suppressor-like RCC1 family protein